MSKINFKSKKVKSHFICKILHLKNILILIWYHHHHHRSKKKSLTGVPTTKLLVFLSSPSASCSAKELKLLYQVFWWRSSSPLPKLTLLRMTGWSPRFMATGKSELPLSSSKPSFRLSEGLRSSFCVGTAGGGDDSFAGIKFVRGEGFLSEVRVKE